MSLSALYRPATHDWEPTRILSRWATAGYQQGQAIDFTAIPVVARPMTLPDIHYALVTAPPGAVVLPQGLMVIEDILELTTNGRVLLGHENGTTLVFPKSLYDLRGAGIFGKVDLGIGYGYAWGGGHIWARSIDETHPLMDVGVGRLTIKYPDHKPYEGHWKERGFNGIYFYTVDGGWIKDVDIYESDSGFICEGKRITVENVRVMNPTSIPFADPGSGKVIGHYGTAFAVHDGLIKNCQFAARHYHDLNVAYDGTVVTGCSGGDLNFDMHAELGSSILFDNCNLGLGARPWDSSGVFRNEQSGPNNCVWNLRKGDGSRVSTLPLSGGHRYDWFLKPDGTHAPRRITIVRHTQTKNDGITWVEAIDHVEPASLYSALRDGWTPPSPAPVPPGPFTVGQTVTTSSQVNVRSSPSKPADNSNLLGTQPLNAVAVIVTGPQSGDAITWWLLNFSSGVDGWVGQDKLLVGP